MVDRMDAFSFSVSQEGIGTLVFDMPGEKVNKLTSDVMGQLDKQLSLLSGYSTLRVLIIRSGKPGMFIAGADISEIETINDIAQGEQKSVMGQSIFNKLAALPFPTIAAIEGVALGGGLELALACTFRVASDHERVQLGLPEVNLGIMPGFGGTQRLPRLIGLEDGLPMILSGSTLDGMRAVKKKLVDACYPVAFFEERLQAFALSLRVPAKVKELKENRARLGSLRVWFMNRTFIGRMIVFRMAERSILSKTHGLYPAPLAALLVVKHGFSRTLQVGLRLEAQEFAKLVPTLVSKRLIQLFYAQEALKKESRKYGEGKWANRRLDCGVLGAGIMGGGIAWLLSQVGTVRLKDLTWEAIAQGYSTANGMYAQLLKRRKVRPNQVELGMRRFSGSLDFSGFKNKDVVIEAVVEQMSVKQAVFRELELAVSEHTIIATNTSALSVTEMATVLNHPERFCGMHFFNPVNKMPLVEVIPGEKTSQETVAAIVQLSKLLKKTPIVVKNCPGFLVNRILIPYVNEAIYLLQDGAKIDRIDAIATAFGMPMGPLMLADEVGLDVGYKVAKNLEEGYGDRMKLSESFESLHRCKNLLGRKSGSGFYLYDHRKHPNPVVYEWVKQSGVSGLTDADILDRLFLTLVNESARCLEESVVENAADLDMAMILGTGFPPFRGGVLRYADDRGISEIVDRLGEFQARFGDRFSPAPLLVKMAEQKIRFFEENL